jgi:hypothetical protein
MQEGLLMDDSDRRTPGFGPLGMAELAALLGGSVQHRIHSERHPRASQGRPRSPHQPTHGCPRPWSTSHNTSKIIMCR